MEKVTGIGGFFFRAKDPSALAAWYQQHLGINPTPKGPNDPVWEQAAGQTVFAPFKQDTKYFGNPEKVWMINFRVANLDRLVAQLQAAGITMASGPEDSPVGRFARIHDPEGNPIELWEPPPDEAKG